MDNVTRLLMQGAAGAAGGGTFVDDVFSTYVYAGNATAQYTPHQIVNGVDNTKGGLVWIKNRTYAQSHTLLDTERVNSSGHTKELYSDTNAAQSEAYAGYNITAFNNNGFKLEGNGTGTNRSGDDYVSWNFRKAKGFFDIVTYTGNGDLRTIAHSLGSVPGCIMIKCTSQAQDWVVYHRSSNASPEDYVLRLNDTHAAFSAAAFNNTLPTSTNFSLGTAGSINGNGETYVAYIFAGGESTADTARSVAFTSGSSSNQNAQSLTIANSSDIDFGSGDFTMECWFKDTRNSDWSDLDTIFSMSGYTNSSNNESFSIYQAQGGFVMFNRTGGGFDQVVDSRTNISEVGQWHHFAWTRSGSGTNNNKIWLDGNLHAQFTRNVTYTDGQDFYIGGNQYSGGGTPNEYGFNGKISNVRITKGTALYTSSFRPPTKPLENITNTKLLCCNNSSVTGGTVIPSSPNTYSINVTASSSSAYTLSGNDRNGSVSGNNVTVTVNVGDTLNFAVNASGHPFYIRDSNGGYNVSTPAATNQGSQSGTVSWTPNTAGSFVYQCGNHSSMIGTITVNAASGSITSTNSPTASTDSPFDDPEGFKFGEEGDQNIIKCGGYDGNGSSTGQEVYLGFEPQWVLYKCTNDSNESWTMYDLMRGIVTGGNEKGLYPNYAIAEENQAFMDLTPTGYKITSSDSRINGSSKKYIYIAIRRPDGYVGKPPEAGTDVFAIDSRNTNQSAAPAFDSGFPADFALMKKPTVVESWFTNSRLTQDKYLLTNASGAEVSTTYMNYEYNEGFGTGGLDSTYYAWMWKRHAGFDVVTYTGNATAGYVIPHSMNKTIEMMWVKNRGDTDPWFVWHHGLNGGTNPEQYSMEFNNAAEASISYLNNVAPTSTHFTVGSHGMVNNNNAHYLAMLFVSVDGISKVGYYTGNGQARTITVGFQPRFLLFRNIDQGQNWHILDTTRGWGSGNDPYLNLNSNAAQNSGDDLGAPTSTGFTWSGGGGMNNNNGDNYIYYAHA